VRRDFRSTVDHLVNAIERKEASVLLLNSCQIRRWSLEPHRERAIALAFPTMATCATYKIFVLANVFAWILRLPLLSRAHARSKD
jgi:hypothetical protein